MAEFLEKVAGFLQKIDYPPVWLAGFMAIAWVLGALWSPIGDTLLWTGRAMIIAGIWLAVRAVLAFRRARTSIVPRAAPSALVETGPYRHSRNPIYIADLMILAGWVLTTGQPLGLVLLWPFLKVLERRFVLPEEAVLERELGAPYREFRERVPRWF